MAYLPPDPTNATSFPEAYGKDIAVVIKMIAEKWQRHFPKLAYYSLKKATTPQPDLDKTTGEAGKTQFDPVWGEDVPVEMATGWEQPHADDAANAVAPALFEDPVNLHIRLQRTAKDEELKKYGFDKIRDVLALTPLSLLDAAGVTIRTGDYFIWDGDEYAVLQYDRKGYWKNSNVRLYMVMNCQHRRPGS